MISIADLLTENQIPGNYFAVDTYVRGDLELGLIENRQGDRLIALPETLIQAIYAGLDKETGQASGLVLFNCGRWWGRNFYTRFCEQLTDYYGTAPADMPMIEFLQALQQCWIAHGWGRIELDQANQQHGFLVIKIWNSPFARLAPRSDRPACHLEAGILSIFFSQLTGRDLQSLQTSCESMGADCNRFVLALSKRLHALEALAAQADHDAVIQQLCL